MILPFRRKNGGKTFLEWVERIHVSFQHIHYEKKNSSLKVMMKHVILSQPRPLFSFGSPAIQLSRISLAILSHVFPWSSPSLTKSTTCWLSITSQITSHASTRNSSPWAQQILPVLPATRMQTSPRSKPICVRLLRKV